MSVKLADTLQAMADFPVAMASGINIVKEDDTEKDLQQMYEDGELGGESMPMPLSANMLLVSENDETSGDLIWSQIDKSEVGSVPLICTEQEWEELDPKPVEGTEVIITDDEDGVNKELIDDNTISVDTTWSSNKINASLGELIKTKFIILPYSNLGNGESKVYNLYNYGIEMEGYTPIGIIGFRAENVGIVPAHMTIVNDPYGVIIRNISGATASDSCSVTVLYVKSS